MKVYNSVLVLIFAAFAYLQLNDPDPILWVSIYLITALIFGFRVAGIYRQNVLLLLMVLLGLYMLVLSPSILDWIEHSNEAGLMNGMSENRPYIEESREFFGLLIAQLALVSQLFLRSKT